MATQDQIPHSPHPLSNQEVLFTRQRHEADRMGLHWDYRIVLGDKAYSWATKKEMPEPGKSIILFEQPVHDREYALSEKVVIPKGEYGGGTTYLDWVRKAKIDPENEPGKIVVKTKDGERFLIKKLDAGKYGEKSWLFKNLTSPDLSKSFSPDLTPAQMEILGTLKHKGSQYGEGEDKDNFFGVSASQKTWPESWHNEQHPQGWYQWYKGYAEGKRTDDDERQIKRWLSFKARHLAQLQKADPTLSDLSIQPKRRQALLNWAIAPGINVEQEVEKKNKYLVKVAEKTKWNDKADLDAAMSVASLIGIPMGMAANKLGGDVGKSVHVPAPDIANKHTVRHFLRENPILHDKVIFERNNGSIPPSVRGISNHTGPAYVNRSFMPDSPNHDVIVGMQGKGKNHAVTMHELGHAKDFNTGNTKLKLGLTRLRSGLGVTAASTLAYGLATNDKTENYAPLASLIPGAVTLRAETAANVHAYKGIKSHMGSGSANKFLKKFIPKQMGAYAIGAAIPAVTTLTAVHMLKSKRKAREEHRAKIAAKKALELK